MILSKYNSVFMIIIFWSTEELYKFVCVCVYVCQVLSAL